MKLLSILLVLLTVILSGCGVNREDHDKILIELEKSKSDLEAKDSSIKLLAEKLGASNQELSVLKGEMEALKKRASEVDSALSEARKEKESLQVELQNINGNGAAAKAEIESLKKANDALSTEVNANLSKLMEWLEKNIAPAEKREKANLEKVKAWMEGMEKVRAGRRREFQVFKAKFGREPNKWEINQILFGNPYLTEKEVTQKIAQEKLDISYMDEHGVKAMKALEKLNEFKSAVAGMLELMAGEPRKGFSLDMAIQKVREKIQKNSRAAELPSVNG